MMNWIKKIFGLGNVKQEPQPIPNMKKFLIVGLGNMGEDYSGTRHNVGFMIADRLASDAGVSFNSCRYGDMAKVRVKNCELMVLKPSTFMNLSGVAVRYWMNKEKLPLEQLLVLVDDLSLPLGTIRIRQSGSEAGHNGLKNISEQLGTRNYARLKFGIGNNFPKGGQVDFVLSLFEPEEELILNEKINLAAEAVKAFCLSGCAFAMNHFNK